MFGIALALVGVCGPFVGHSQAHMDLRDQAERRAAADMAFSYFDKVRPIWKLTKWPQSDTIRITSHAARFPQFLETAQVVSAAAGVNIVSVDGGWNSVFIETDSTNFQVKQLAELIHPIIGDKTAEFIAGLAYDSGQCTVQTQHNATFHIYGAVLIIFTDRVDETDYQRCVSVLSMGLMGLLYPTQMNVESVMNLKFKAGNSPTDLDLRVVHAVYDSLIKAGTGAEEFSRSVTYY
jgi:hypothetical protein